MSLPITTSHHFQAGKLIVTEPLCRPFILFHLCYIILNTITRFLLPTPLPQSYSPSLLCLPSTLPFHHSRNMLHHLLSSFTLLLLNTLSLAHTTPFLLTDPTPSHSWRRLRSPSELRAAQRPARVVPVWLRGGGGGGDRDGLVMWDWSVCVVLMYGVALVLSLLHQRLFSPFTFPPPTSSSSSSPSSSSTFASLSQLDRRRQLQLSYFFSVLLLLALSALLFCAYQLHFDAFIYLLPWSLIETMRVLDNWLVLARGGKVRGEVERRAKEDAEEQQAAKRDAESDRRELDQLASFAVRSGLHQRHPVSRADG